MLNNMRIKNKLILAFVLIGLFSTIVGAFGLGAVFRTNENTNDIYSGHLIPTTYLFNIQKNMMLMSNNYDLMIYEKDILQAEKRMKQIDSWSKENGELLQKYEGAKTSETDLYETLKKDLKICNAIMDQMGTLISSNDISGTMNLAPNFHSRTNLVDKDIQNLIDEETGNAHASLMESQRTFQISLFTIIGIAFLCLFAAFAAGTVISKKLSKPIVDLSVAAEQLALGDVDIAVETEARDEIGDLVISFNRMTENIKEQAENAQKIAEGDLDIEIKPQSDKDVLGISMQIVVNILRNLVEESSEMTGAALKGDLTHRGDSRQFSGGYHDIIEGFNQTLEAVVQPLNTSAACFKRISRGDIPELITEEYQGDFKKIVEGLNKTMDAVTGPLYIAAEYIEKIGRGEIPEEITAAYHGEFNEIKNNINSCIEGLGTLIEGKDILSRMSSNDFTGHMKEDSLGIYNEIAVSINHVTKQVNELTGLINHVAVGNFEDLNRLKSIGKRSEKDVLIPSIILMMDTLKRLVEETNSLTRYAISGELSRRGGIDQFRGEYKKLIQGINQTMDAIIQPVEEASAVLKELATGNLNVMMEGNYQGDHAEIKTAMNDTIQNLRGYISEISEVLTEIGKGNLELTITEQYKGDFIEIKDSLNSIIFTLNQVMRQINIASDQVASGSRQVSDGSQALSQGSTEQASSIEELSASITEITEQIKQSSVNANEASSLAMTAKENAKKGNEQMDHMLISMAKINASSMDISKIIKVIDDIAFQTNILALNAAVEAARAGQHGKGFAVVAEEVRGLAARSAEAAKRTSELIAESIHKAQTGASIANETAAAFHDIVFAIDGAAEFVKNIAETSNRQASGIVMINRGIEQVAQIVQNNSATAEQSAAASQQLSSQAELLMEMVGRFQTEERMEIAPDSGNMRLLERPSGFDLICS